MFKNNAYIKKKKNKTKPKTRQNPEGSMQVRPRVQLLQIMDFIFFFTAQIESIEMGQRESKC